MPPRRLQAGAALLLCTAVSAGLAADPVIDQLDAARRAYENGEPRVAIQALNFAIAQIEEQETAKQLQLFPEPLQGWIAEQATAESGGIAAMLTGKILSRTYRNEASGAEVQIMLSANAPFLGALTSLMQMPMLLQSDPNTSLYTHGSYRGMLKQDPGDGSLELSLIIGSNILLQLSGSDGADRAALEAYLEAMDIAAIQKALSG
jgi:hypothetical protein